MIKIMSRQCVLFSCFVFGVTESTIWNFDFCYFFFGCSCLNFCFHGRKIDEIKAIEKNFLETKQNQVIQSFHTLPPHKRNNPHK